MSAGEATDAVTQGIYDGTIDLLAVFPENFLEQVNHYAEGGVHPDVETYYNPTESYSQLARERFVSAMQEYEKQLLADRFGGEDMLTAFTVDAATGGNVIMDTKKAGSEYLSMMLPYLITLLLFAGTMSLGTDTISGEKERGTMAGMLVTPVQI